MRDFGEFVRVENSYDYRLLQKNSREVVVGVERTPTNVGSPTIVKLFICYYIELDKVSDTSPEPPVYKVRLFKVSK